MKFILSLMVCLWGLILNAQVAYVAFPADYEMYARNLQTNKGYVAFDFILDAGVDPDSILLKKYSDGPVTIVRGVNYSVTGQRAHFKGFDTIEASLHACSYELWFGTSKLLRKAEQVCCGDFYVLYGQSNAVAEMKVESCAADCLPFIRTYGNSSETASLQEWAVATGDGPRLAKGHIGQLGIAIAAELTMKNKIPVCIINGAVGAKGIQYFLRDEQFKENPQTAYGRLLTRINESCGAANLRALIWYQGENDAYAGTEYDTYLQQFHTLYNSWLADFKNLENVYAYQIKNGCNQNPVSTARIQQAQLDMAQLGSKMQLISTSDLAQSPDHCHFGYLNGYKLLGQKAAKIINYHQYHGTDTLSIFSPLIQAAILVDSLHVKVVAKKVTDRFSYPEILKDFYLNSNFKNPVGLKVVNDTILLTFAEPVASGDGISYTDIQSTAAAYNGVLPFNGTLCFYNQHFENTVFVQPENYTKNTEHLFSYQSKGELYIYSKSSDLLKAHYRLYAEDGYLEQNEKLEILSGMNRYQLNAKPGRLYLLILQVQTAAGQVNKTFKIFN